MATIIRPSVIRQAHRGAQPQRLFTSTTSATTSLSTIIRSRLEPRPARPFHTTAPRAILPPLPQKLSGTANEAAPVPTPSPTHGNYHWDFERAVSIALVPVTIAPFAAGSLHPVTDAVLCALLIVHSHVGFTSCIIDYLPSKRIPKTRKSFEWILRLSTLGVAVGLYEFETNDVGVTEAIARIWKA